MKLLGSTKNSITKAKNVANIILVNCNIVKDIYQHYSKVLHAFVKNKSFSQFLEVSSTNLTFYNTFNTEFLNTEIWFTNQNDKLLEKEDQINIDLVILIYKNNFN